MEAAPASPPDTPPWADRPHGPTATLSPAPRENCAMPENAWAHRGSHEAAVSGLGGHVREGARGAVKQEHKLVGGALKGTHLYSLLCAKKHHYVVDLAADLQPPVDPCSRTTSQRATAGAMGSSEGSSHPEL